MMNKVSFGFALLRLLFISCNKTDPVPASGETPAATRDDARSVLLKDIEADNLPAPYFHFEYDSLHYVKNISFASQLFIYNVEYENKRVKRMISARDRNSLVYSYSANGEVSDIKEYSPAGNLLFKYQFLYDSNRLVQATWYKYSDVGRENVIKRADLSYYADGNLSTLDLYYPSATGQLAWSSMEAFFDYDSQTNVDDILLLKDFFGSYLFLPQEKLQKNNPTRERITSDVNDYETQNNFDYRNGLPVVKYSLVNQTKGGNGQGPIRVETHYTYY